MTQTNLCSLVLTGSNSATEEILMAVPVKIAQRRDLGADKHQCICAFVFVCHVWSRCLSFGYFSLIFYAFASVSSPGV